MSRMVRARPGLVAERVGGSYLLLDVERAVCSELNQTGTFLWEQLPTSVPDLARLLAERYPVAGPRAVDDVEAWVAALLADGWVTVGE